MASVVDRQALKAVLSQLAVESLGVDPSLIEQGSSHPSAAELIRVPAGRLAGLMDKMVDVALALPAEAGYAGGNGRGRASSLLLSEAVDGLLLATRAKGSPDSTLKWYKSRIAKFLHFSGDRYVSDFQAADIRAFIVSLYDQGNLSESYIAAILRAIKRLFDWCEEEGYLANNPMDRIKIPKPGDTEPKFITWDNFLRLLATTQRGTIADRRDAAEMLVMYDTGCRVSELCALRVGDLHLEEGQLKRTERKVKKERRRPILDAVVQSIRAWLEVRPEVETDALFVNLGVNDCGQPITPNSVRLMLKRRAEVAGVTGRFNPHSFRHARGRDYVMAGGDTTTGSAILGHTTEQTFSRFYARFGIGELQEKHAKHNVIASRLGYVEMQPQEAEDALPPLEFVAGLEVVDVAGPWEVERHFDHLFGDRHQVAVEDLLDGNGGGGRMLEHLLDYCGTPGFGFEVVFPPVDSANGAASAVGNGSYEVSSVIVRRSNSHSKDGRRR